MAASLLDPNTYESALSELFSQGNSAAQTSYDQSNSALGSYLSTLQNQQNGVGQVNLPLMAFAAGLGAPTRTGSFGESLSSAMSGAIPVIQSGREAELQRAAMMAKIGVAKANLGNELVDRKLQMLQTPAVGMKALSDALSSKADANFMTGQPPGGGTKPGAAAVGAGARVGGARADAAEPATPSPVPSNATAAAVPPPAPTAPPPGPADVAPVAQAAAQAVQQKVAQADTPTAQATPVQSAPLPAPDLSTIQPPPVDVAQAPAITPLQVPKDWTPGQVNLGGGVVGYRPTAAMARQLDAMSQIAAMGQQYRGSPKAAAYAQVGQEYMKQFTDKGYYWDPQNKVLVGYGTQDPQAQRNLELGKKRGTNQADAEYALEEQIQPGTNGLGPVIQRRKIDVLNDAANAEAGPGYVAPGTGEQLAPASPVVKGPGAMGKEQVDARVKAETELRTRLPELDKTVKDADEGKRLLGEYNTGDLNPAKAKVVSVLRSLGFDVNTEEASSWDPAKLQQMEKLAMRQVFDDVKNMGGRVLVSEIQGFQAATYNPKMQPESNRAIMASLNAATKYKAKYATDLGNYLSQHPYDTDITGFANKWREENHYADFYKHELTTTVAAGAKTGIPAQYFQMPPEADRYNGMKINTPHGIATWTVGEDGAGTWVPQDYPNSAVKTRKD